MLVFILWWSDKPVSNVADIKKWFFLLVINKSIHVEFIQIYSDLLRWRYSDEVIQIKTTHIILSIRVCCRHIKIANKTKFSYIELKKFKARFNSWINERSLREKGLKLPISSHFSFDTLNSNKIISEISLNL